MKWPGSLESCHQSPLDGKSEAIVESWKSKYPALNVVGDRFSGSEYLDECGDNVGVAWVMRSSSELAIAIRDSLRQGNAQLVDKGGANLSADRGPFFVLLGRDVKLMTLLDANHQRDCQHDGVPLSPKIWMVDSKRYQSFSETAWKFHP